MVSTDSIDDIDFKIIREIDDLHLQIRDTLNHKDYFDEISKYMNILSEAEMSPDVGYYPMIVPIDKDVPDFTLLMTFVTNLKQFVYDHLDSTNVF